MTMVPRVFRVLGHGGQANTFSRAMPLAILRRVVVTVVVPLACCSLLPACNRQAAAPPPPPPTVTVAKPVAKKITDRAEYTGRLAAVERVDGEPGINGPSASSAHGAMRMRSLRSSTGRPSAWRRSSTL